MNYYANFAATVSDDSVQKCVGEELFDKFIYAVQHLSVGEEIAIKTFNDCGDCGDYDDGDVQDYLDVVNEICDVFCTKTGMELSREYHTNDREDDIVMYWEIPFEQAFSITDAALHYNQKMGSQNGIEITQWVSAG
jgi:hypothetical protein